MQDQKWLQGRINHYRKHFARKAGKPGRHTALREAAITRAATMAALADQTLGDPHASINDKIRVSGAADRAYASMVKTLAEPAQTATNEWADFVSAASKASAA